MEAGHNQRLDLLEEHAGRTEGRLSVIENIQKDHGVKLDGIGSTLSTISLNMAKTEGRTPFDFHVWVKTIGVLLGIAAAFATLSTWLIITLTRSDIELINYKLATQENRLDDIRKAWTWRPTLESAK